MAKNLDVVSPSCLKDLNSRPRKLSKAEREACKLGLGDWTVDEDEADLAPKSKKRLSLVKKPKDKENRWGFIDTARDETLCQRFV